MNDWIQKNLTLPKVSQLRRNQQRMQIVEFLKKNIIQQLKNNQKSSLYHLHSKSQHLPSTTKHLSQLSRRKVKNTPIRQFFSNQTTPTSQKHLPTTPLHIENNKKPRLHSKPPLTQQQQMQLSFHDKSLSKHKSNIISKSNMRLKVSKVRTQKLQDAFNKNIQKGQQFLSNILEIKQLGRDHSDRIIKISFSQHCDQKPNIIRKIARNFKNNKKTFINSILGWKTESSNSESY